MRMSRRGPAVAALLGVLAVLLPASPAFALKNPPPGSTLPLIPGSRVVHLRDESGGLETFTSFPVVSDFATFGGVGSTCVARVSGDDPATPDVVESDFGVVSTRWIFIENRIPPEWLGGPIDLPDESVVLASRVRRFSVYCLSTDIVGNFRGVIDVPPSDPFLDPHVVLPTLYNGLQLAALSLYRNPVVNRWGGLVTRSPVWLAIDPVGWVTQRSNVVSWRGWQLALIARPKALEFTVDFVPDRARPSLPFSGVVPCVGAGERPVAWAGALPGPPVDLAVFAPPGVGAPCMWTPPGPGVVSVTARATFVPHHVIRLRGAFS